MSNLCEETLKPLVENANFFTSDSRLTDKNTIFVALSGEKSDGHDFIHDALSKGVVACIAEKKVDIDDPKVIYCDNSAEAHRIIAKLFRNKFEGKVIAIGGSNGKTTAKDFLYTLLEKKFSCIKTLHSQNGYQGIPATLERLRPGLNCAIIEVGIDAPGDMAAHTKVVSPDIAILTSIGAEHLRLLKDLDTVFKEESILVKSCLNNGGKAFVPSSDKYLSKLEKNSNLNFCPDDPTDLDPDYKLEHITGIARKNATLAICCALELGLSKKEIIEQSKNLRIPKGRGTLEKITNTAWILEDQYNANLSSMMASTTFAQQKADELKLPLTLVLGDMLDLGEESLDTHVRILKHIESLSPQSIILVGNEFKKASSGFKALKAKLYKDSNELSTKITEIIKQPCLCAFKGSRGMQLEIAISKLRNSF